jgi:hypothetical protein
MTSPITSAQAPATVTSAPSQPSALDPDVLVVKIGAIEAAIGDSLSEISGDMTASQIVKLQSLLALLDASTSELVQARAARRDTLKGVVDKMS